MSIVLNSIAAHPLFAGEEQLLARDTTTSAAKTLGLTEISLRSLLIPAGTWRDGEIIRLRWSFHNVDVATYGQVVTQQLRIGPNGAGANIQNDTQISTASARPNTTEVGGHYIFEIMKTAATKIRPITALIIAPYSQNTSTTYGGFEITVPNMDTASQYLSVSATAAAAEDCYVTFFEAVKR